MKKKVKNLSPKERYPHIVASGNERRLQPSQVQRKGDQHVVKMAPVQRHEDERQARLVGAPEAFDARRPGAAFTAGHPSDGLVSEPRY